MNVSWYESVSYDCIKLIVLKMYLIKSYYVLSLMFIISLSGFEQTPINLMDIKINISSIISCIYVKSYFNIEKLLIIIV